MAPENDHHPNQNYDMWNRTISHKVASDVAQRIDISARVADSLNLLFSFFNPAAGAFSLVNYELVFTIHAGQTDVLVATEADALTNNGAGGTVSLDLTALQMAAPSAGTYSYTLKATDKTPGASYSKVWLAGTFYLRREEEIGAVEGGLNTGKTVVRIKDTDITVSVNN